MAELRIERKPKMGSKWLWLPLAAAVAVLLMLALFNWRSGPGEQAGLYQPGKSAGALSYQGETLIPAGEPLDFPADQMVAVGKTAEGYTLFANREQGFEESGGGGGGGRGDTSPNTDPQAWGRIYLKTTDGQYVRLFQRSGLE